MKRKLTLLFLSLLVLIAKAQVKDSTNVDFYDMSLEELLNLKVSVASKSELTVRESPSIISVITAEEIQAIGARDLMDVLNLIPGFNFGTDVFGVVGMSARGNWSHEGKLLLLLDGQEMNDLSYANTQFGQRYDVSQIDRIEILRGPGSSVYGGSAALGVVKIITKGAALKGIQVSSTYGQLSNKYARRNVTLAVGNKNSNDFSYSISGYLGQGRRSNLDFTNSVGVTTNLSSFTRLFPGMINAGLQIKNFSARLILDKYEVETPSGYVDIKTDTTEISSFHSLFSEIKYDVKAGNRWTITPKVNYKIMSPWALEKDSPNGYYEVVEKRMAPSVNMVYNSDGLGLVMGVDSFFDHAEHKNKEKPEYKFPNGDYKVDFYNIGVFGQAHIKKLFLPLFVGFRFDHHNQYGSAFSPRVGITKVLNAWNFKVLYSRAFRAPAIENIRYNPKVVPERSGVAEVQVGYKVSESMTITANAYDIRVKHPMVYGYNDEFPDGTYLNYSRSGTRGVEVEYRYKGKLGFISANYAYYSAAGLNKVEAYAVPGHSNNMLAWPSHKVNVYAGLKVSPKMTITPTVTYISKRYGFYQYYMYDPDESLLLKKYDPKIYFNLFLRWTDIVNGLNAGIGVDDITNQKQLFIQPHDSGFAPLPGVGREFVVKLSYKLKFN